MLTGNGARPVASARRRDGGARSLRRLQLIDRPRLAREHIARLLGQGKTVKILCVGKKGYDQLRRQYQSQIIELIELRGLRQVGFDNADPIGKKVIELFEAGEFDVATLFFSQFKSVMAQIPTALQLIPAQIPATRTSKRRKARRRLTNMSRRGEILADLLPRNIVGPGVPRAA